MSGARLKFGQMLTEAIRRIQSLESKNIGVIQDELGYVVERSAHTIEHWRKGHLPIDEAQIEKLVFAIADRTDYDNTWLNEFLKASGHSSSQALSDKLRPVDKEMAHEHRVSPLTDILIPVHESSHPLTVKTFVGRQPNLFCALQNLHENHYEVICGMPGIGKTALASELVRQLSRPKEYVFWHTVRLGETIDDILWRLANHLAWHGQDRFLRAIQSMHALPQGALFDSLLYTISRKGYLLCIDDFHLFDEQVVAEQLIKPMEQYIGRGEIDLLVLSRHNVNLRSIVSSNELSGFTLTECYQFLSQLGLSLTDDQVQILHQITQGNPQLLTLLCETLRQSDDTQRPSVDIAMHPGLESYFLREIDDQLTDAERRIMRTVAILNGTIGTREVIEALSDVADVWKVLNDLTRRNLLTVTRYSGIRHYSQHELVKTFYYDSIELLDRVNRHKLAGTFFEDNHDPVSAAQQFELAGENVRVVELIVANLALFICKGRASYAADRLESYLSTEQPDPGAYSVQAGLRVTVHKTLGIIYRIQGQYSQSLDCLQNGLKLVEQSTNHATLYYEMGYACEAQGDYDSALEYYGQCLAKARAEDTGDDLVLAHFGLGWAHYRLGQKDEARSHFGDALSFTQKNIPDITGRILLGLGSIEWQDGEHASALAHFEESYAIFQQSHDVGGEAQAMNNIGAIYYEMGDLSKTLAYWESMIEIFEEIGDVSNLMFGYSNLGFLHLREHASHIASEHYDRMIMLAEKSNHQRMLCRAYAGKSEAKSQNEQIEDAFALAQNALDIASKNAFDAERGIACRSLSLAHIADNNLTIAVDWLTKSIEYLDAAAEYSFLRLAEDELKEVQTTQ